MDGTQKAKLDTQTSFDLGDLACGTAFTPGVETIASDGNVSALSTTRVTTSDCTGGVEPTSLPAPSGLVATVNTQSHLILTWNPVSGASQYNIYLNGSFVNRVTGTPTYDYGVVSCGQTLSPGVSALGQPGQISTTTTVTVSSPGCPGAPADTTPPSVPTNVFSVFPSETGFTIGWSPSTDDVGVVGYDVYLNGSKIAVVGAGTIVPSLGNIGYVFTGLSCGNTYQVGVDAFDAAGNVSAQATKTASTTQCPSNIPAPTGVYATVNSMNGVSLYWDAVSGVSEYDVWLNGQEMLTVSGTSFGYGPLTCGQTYTLGVQSVVNDQVSAVATATATTNSC